MRYTKAQVLQKIKLNLGYGVVQIEMLDQHIEEAIEQALDIYDEYFTNYRFKSISVGSGSNMFRLSTVPGVLTDVETRTDQAKLGTILTGQTTATISPLPNIPLLPNSCLISIGSILCKDDGNGVLIGEGLDSGTIDYTTGSVSLTLVEAVIADTEVEATYNYSATDDLAILDVLEVNTLDPVQERQALTAYGIFDRTGIVMNKLTETAASYYDAMKGLADQANLFGAGLNWQYYPAAQTLFIYTTNTGAVSVKLAVRPAIADIASENTGTFMKLATAKAKEILGRIRGKYKGVEIPGGTLDVDGDTLLAESAKEIAEVLETFTEKRNPNFVVIK